MKLKHRIARPFLQGYFNLHYRWFYKFYREGVAQKPLEAGQQAALEALRRDGIVMSQIPSSDLAEMQAHMRGLELNAPHTTKPFLQYMYDTLPVYNLDDPIHAYMQRWQTLADHYLETKGHISYLMLNRTNPVRKGSPWVASQRWHRDADDRQVLRLFIYLNDVDETSGPFMYIRGSQCGGRNWKKFPQHPPLGKYLANDVAQHFNKNDVVVCAGKAGTLILADAAGLHRGGYATEKERIMFQGGWLTAASPTIGRIKGGRRPGRVLAKIYRAYKKCYQNEKYEML